MITSPSVLRPRVTDERDRMLLQAIECGLPLVSRPYAAVGERLGMTEDEVVQRLAQLKENGVIKRFGVVVRHHELGYGANAMVVWDVADDRVAELGRKLAAFDFVTLCYRRERSQPEWPYNLYCMIHGRDRASVEQHIATLVKQCNLAAVPRSVLFSVQRFKQCGAMYSHNTVGAARG